MKGTINRGVAAVATGAILVAGLGACSSTPKISKDKLATDVKKTLNDRDVKATKVTCTDSLEAKVGATSKCDATVSGTTQHLVAKVDSVNGKTVSYTVSKA